MPAAARQDRGYRAGGPGEILKRVHERSGKTFGDFGHYTSVIVVRTFEAPTRSCSGCVVILRSPRIASFAQHLSPPIARRFLFRPVYKFDPALYFRSIKKLSQLRQMRPRARNASCLPLRQCTH